MDITILNKLVVAASVETQLTKQSSYHTHLIYKSILLGMDVNKGRLTVVGDR